MNIVSVVLVSFFFDLESSNNEWHTLHTVDGRNPAKQLRLVVYPIICEGFLAPSQVVVWDFWTTNSTDFDGARGETSR